MCETIKPNVTCPFENSYENRIETILALTDSFSFRFFLVAQAFKAMFRSILSLRSFSVASTIRPSRRSPDIVDRRKFFIIFILLNVLSFVATVTGAVSKSL